MIGYVIGTYKITEKIGEGGMGAVFKGVDTMLDREVAIKMLRPEFSRQPLVVERFRSEAVTLAKLSHPNVGILHAFLRQGDEYFMVMEFVHGETLDSIIRRTGRLESDRAIKIFLQALDGIEHAHEHGIIHRDIKPANIMLTPKGLVKVMDFGIARLIGTSRMTTTGNLIGTIEYMSPEQIEGQEVDLRSDIYSLGILLYEMVTGAVPFRHTSEYGLMKMQIEDPPRSPRDLVPNISLSLEQTILRALMKKPPERFQSAAEFRQALLTAEGTTPAGFSQTDNIAIPSHGAEIRETRVAANYPSGGISSSAAPTASARRGWTIISIAFVAALVLLGFALVTLKNYFRDRDQQTRAEVSSSEAKNKPGEKASQAPPTAPPQQAKVDVSSSKDQTRNTNSEPIQPRPPTGGAGADAEAPKPDQPTERFVPATPATPQWEGGHYSGSCTNLTVQKSARLDLDLQTGPYGKVSGRLTITDDLTGSGPLAGRADGQSIQFTSVEINSGMKINWSGTIEGKTIKGSYTVAPLPERGIRVQTGVWQVSMK